MRADASNLVDAGLILLGEAAASRNSEPPRIEAAEVVELVWLANIVANGLAEHPKVVGYAGPNSDIRYFGLPTD